jgi:sulfatase modifying factor 1
MKKIKFLFTIIWIATLASCGLNSDRGELTGVLGRKPWFHPQPYGTVYVPTGTIHIGQSAQDINASQMAQNKQISIVAFYMDDTEITNNEYRQFVYYVIDSLARELVGDEMKKEIVDGPTTYMILDYEKELDWEAQADALEPMYYPENERFRRKKQLDVRKLIYKYEWEDLQAAAAAAKEPTKVFTSESKRTFWRDGSIQVYPDTLVFVRDFTYSFNEPMTQMYFWHPKYDDYPVVGVNWRQATAFCDWRTRHLNNYYEFELEEPIVTPFRLPTEYEWEYAARGGQNANMYPWGGPYVRNSKGCFLANFKPGRGNYIDDGGFYPVKGASYFPNDFGLYCMSGNVAEWTSSAYAEAAHKFTDDMNPDYKYNATDDESETMKRKVIRGGSWKDISFYLQNSTRTYEYQDTTKSFVGFRCVMTYIGRSNKDRF